MAAAAASAAAISGHLAGCSIPAAAAQRVRPRLLPASPHAQQQQLQQQQQRRSSHGGSRRCLVAVRASAAQQQQASPRGPVVVIDNYDSFTYNLCQYMGDLGAEFVVFKNDETTVEAIRALNPAGILVSPGPGKPIDSGISLQVVRELGPEFPLFGVCMGHQCIGEAFGGDVVRAPCGVMHGKTSPVHHTNVGILEGLENPFLAARYHSLVIAKESCPDDLEVTAWTEDGTIMAVRHKRHPHIQGVQFHPESIITQNGKRIVANFVASVQQHQQQQQGGGSAAAAADEQQQQQRAVQMQ